MNKKRRSPHQQSRFGIARKRVATYGVIAAIISIVAYFGYSYMIPVNSTIPVLGAPSNHFIKATHSSTTGYHWLSVNSAKSKGLRSTSGNIMNPKYTFGVGGLETFHIINEDYATKSNHNFNIDEFNVHTRNLGYSESQTITFLADKTGTFEYYCNIHHGMNGTITIVERNGA